MNPFKDVEGYSVAWSARAEQIEMQYQDLVAESVAAVLRNPMYAEDSVLRITALAQLLMPTLEDNPEMFAGLAAALLIMLTDIARQHMKETGDEDH